MNSIKKKLALLLAALMTLSLLTACGGSEGADDNSLASTAAGAADPETEEIDSYIDSLAADASFDGASFTYIGRQGDNFIEKQEENGNLLNDAIYKRQRELEEHFGLAWENIITEDGEDTQNKVIDDAMAGVGSYDLVYGAVITVGQPLMTNRVLMSVNDFTTLDLSQDWWISTLEKDFSICGKLYLLTGDIVTNHFSDGGCVLFNKQVADNFDIPDLYQIVKDGEWTVDKMFEIAQAVPAASGGDGVYRYGFGDHRAVGFDLLFANGMSITSFDDEGVPSIPDTLPTALSDFADKMSKTLGDDTLVCTTRVVGNSAEDCADKYGVENIIDMFINDQVLFWFDSTSTVSNLREEDVEFGVLPDPKGNEKLEYRTYAQSGMGGAVFVPKTVKDVEMVDVIVEAMGALSRKYLKPAFYTKMLQGRSTYDSESREMLDIISSTKAYDLVEMFGGGNMNTKGDYVNLIDRAIKMDSASFSSNYKSVAVVTSLRINKLVKSIVKDD